MTGITNSFCAIQKYKKRESRKSWGKKLSRKPYNKHLLRYSSFELIHSTSPRLLMLFYNCCWHKRDSFQPHCHIVSLCLTHWKIIDKKLFLVETKIEVPIIEVSLSVPADDVFNLIYI